MNGATVGILLTDLLQTCVDAFTIVDNSPDAPERQLVSVGEPPPYDGDLLAVWSTGLRIGNPFPLTQSSAVFQQAMPLADLQFLIMRACYPQVGGQTPASQQWPKPEKYQAAALAHAADGATLQAHLTQLAARGGMFPSLPIDTGDVGLTPLVPVGPLVNRVGWRGTVQVRMAVL